MNLWIVFLIQISGSCGLGFSLQDYVAFDDPDAGQELANEFEETLTSDELSTSNLKELPEAHNETEKEKLPLVLKFSVVNGADNNDHVVEEELKKLLPQRNGNYYGGSSSPQQAEKIRQIVLKEAGAGDHLKINLNQVESENKKGSKETEKEADKETNRGRRFNGDDLNSDEAIPFPKNQSNERGETVLLYSPHDAYDYDEDEETEMVDALPEKNREIKFPHESHLGYEYDRSSMENYFNPTNRQKLPARYDYNSHNLEPKRNRYGPARRFREKNSCKRYLEFLRYAFNKLRDEEEEEEEEEVEEDYMEEYEEDYRYPLDFNRPVIYVDNTGTYPQVEEVYKPFSPHRRLPKPARKGKTARKRKDRKGLPSSQHEEERSGEVEERSGDVEERSGDVEERSGDVGERSEDEERPSIVPDEEAPQFRAFMINEMQNTVVNMTLTTFSPIRGQSTLPKSQDVTPNSTIAHQNITDETRGSRIEGWIGSILPCPAKINVTYPLNGYCNRFVTCECGEPIQEVCHDGLHFNIVTKRCDLPQNSICSYACPAANGYFGIPGDCGGYFRCKNWNPEYRMCPFDMQWNVEQSLCIYEELSKCPMKCDQTSEVRPYPGDCSSYIICHDKDPTYHRCPKGTTFDEASMICVDENTSKCTNDQRLIGSQDPTLRETDPNCVKPHQAD